MRNLFTNACIALCCLTCIEHHDEVCGMQPLVNKIIHPKRGMANITFSPKDQQKYKAFFNRLRNEGGLQFQTAEYAMNPPYVYTLRFDVFQNVLRQAPAELQERLGNLINGNVIRLKGYCYFRLADYGIFELAISTRDKQELSSLIMGLPNVALPNVALPNPDGEVHVTKASLDELFQQNEKFRNMFNEIKTRNYVVFTELANREDEDDQVQNNVPNNVPNIQAIYVD